MTTISDSRITESSGLAFSRRHPGVLWTHNDEKGAIYGVRARDGKVVAVIRLKGVTLTDPEAIAVDKHGQMVVADIGDNDASRHTVYLYQLPEPDLGAHTVEATRIPLVYPDGAHNAETLLIHPVTGERTIVTKGKRARVYKLPDKLSKSTPNRLVFVGQRDLPYVSDGCWNLSGSHVFVRQKGVRDRINVLSSSLRHVAWLDAQHMNQPESITVERPDGDAVWFGSEGPRSPLACRHIPQEFQ